MAALLRQRCGSAEQPMVHKQLGLVQNRLGRSGEAFAGSHGRRARRSGRRSLTALDRFFFCRPIEDAESAAPRRRDGPDRQEARYALGRWCGGDAPAKPGNSSS